ncbi:MAG: response regulator [Deltaproteobacteria bacterium]|nr:response regulator [Deltaproteobacteria bacterium]
MSGIESCGRVLVVDDEEDLRQVIGDLLDAEGYDVTTVGSGDEALRLARSNHYDVVTMDLRMPGLSGRDTLAALRHIDPATVPIVVSGYATPDDATAVRELGAYEVLSKPFDVDQLVAVVGGAMSAHRSTTS